MQAIITVIKELTQNIATLHRLALFELINKYKGNVFGALWLWVNPSIQIAIYWGVFGSLRNSAPVDGIPFYLWISTGYILWALINSTTTAASRSLINKMGIITKMKFPISAIPAIVITSEVYVHFLLLLTIIVLLFASGFQLTIYSLQILYFLFATICFLYAFGIFNSSITTVLRDYQHLVYNTMRALFFFTPIAYQYATASGVLLVAMKFNPLTYVVEGYRDALLFNRTIMLTSFESGIYFWSITAIIFIVGCGLHMKMRKNLLDYQ